MDDIIYESMLSYNEYIEKLVEACNLISAKIKEDFFEEGLENILAFSEGIDWLSNINGKLVTLGYNNELNLDLIAEHFKEVNEGLMINDYVLVADIFNYEIKPFLQKLKQYEIPNN